MFRTRDLGRWTPDGELEHLGRTDDQVKVRGFRVELDSVSSVLESVAGCTRAVTLKRDARSLVSFVCPADVDPDTARRAVADVLPYYCVPATVLPRGRAAGDGPGQGRPDGTAAAGVRAGGRRAAHRAGGATVHGEGASLLPVSAAREGAA